MWSGFAADRSKPTDRGSPINHHPTVAAIDYRSVLIWPTGCLADTHPESMAYSDALFMEYRLANELTSWLPGLAVWHVRRKIGYSFIIRTLRSLILRGPVNCSRCRISKCNVFIHLFQNCIIFGSSFYQWILVVYIWEDQSGRCIGYTCDLFRALRSSISRGFQASYKRDGWCAS